MLVFQVFLEILHQSYLNPKRSLKAHSPHRLYHPILYIKNVTFSIACRVLSRPILLLASYKSP
eukprot:UN24779